VYEHQFIFAASRTFEGVFVLSCNLFASQKKIFADIFWLTCQKVDAEKNCLVEKEN
jgi:hypothetical protein